MNDLFAYARNTDPETSHAAAAEITPHLNRLQAVVLDAIHDFFPHGFTDKQLCLVLPDLTDSTVRTRRKELVNKGRVVANGKDETGKHTVWRIA